MAKVTYGHLCLREENLSFINNYMANICLREENLSFINNYM